MKAAVLLLLVALLGGCAFPFNRHAPGNPVCSFEGKCLIYEEKPRDYMIRQRAFVFPKDKVGETLWRDYNEEYQYVAERRKKMRQPLEAAPGQPPNLLAGLALSGGGFRSATFNLGVLQALSESKKLDRIDYMSSVSGGSYLTGWMLSHLAGKAPPPGPPPGCADLHNLKKEELAQCGYDEYGYRVETDDSAELLDNNRDFVRHMRAHRSFFKGESGWSWIEFAFELIARLPFYYFADLGLHVKDFHEQGNEVHLTNVHKDRIEGTFFRGRDNKPLALVNELSRPIAPYLIVNGNLVNRGWPLSSTTYEEAAERDHFNFEFTRHFTGSDGLGYVETQGFDLPVDHVQRDKDGRPERVSVWRPKQRVRSLKGDGTPEKVEGPLGPSFRLSYAVAASGAAFDIDSVWGDFVGDPLTRSVFQFLSLPFNLNFEYQTWNFARRYDGWTTPWDYVRMTTYQRLSAWVTTDARWIEITDGSFYDNLGAFSLLRRGVSHVVVGDATLDSSWTYHYLHQLERRTVEIGFTWCTSLPKRGEIFWTRDFWLKRPDGRFAVLHVLKPYAYNEDLFKKNPDLAKPLPDKLGKVPFLSDDPGGLVPGGPRHLAAPHLATIKEDREHNEKVIKVTQFAQSDRADSFPHTSTLVQWFGWEQFEAYRLLGYLMGKTYLSKINFDQEPQDPLTCPKSSTEVPHQ